MTEILCGEPVKHQQSTWRHQEPDCCPPVDGLVDEQLAMQAATTTDAHRKPVLVQVVVPGHREHDGQSLNVVVLRPLEEVIGQHADTASCFAAGFAIRLRAGEVTEVFPVVHLVIQMFVAGTGVLNHAHGQTVLIQVVVKGHREHDGHALGANPALHMEQVIGQQADSTRGSVVVLGEGAHFSLGGADRRLGGC
ncbi:hypothetical protein INR49_011098 [Caranx melampygus]|nr:hypothetical protein INR49_011098 [Caranx melampygus]